MKKIILNLSFYVVAGCAFAQAPNFAWAKASNSNGDPGAGNIGCVAVDTVNHYVYSLGYFTGGGIDFGTGELAGSSGSKSIYLIKYNLAGGLTWARSFPSPHDNTPTGIAVDRSGNVLITGYSQDDTVRFGSQYLINSHPTSTDHTVAYVVKLDGNGNTIWLKGSTGGGGVLSNAIALDASGNAFITGTVVDNSGSFLGNSLTMGAFVMKLSSSSGNSLWLSQVLPSVALVSEGNSIGVDHLGNCIMVGMYAANITLGPLSLTYSGSSGNSWDRFITMLDGSTGAFAWASSAGSSGAADVNMDVTVDIHDNVFVTGYETIGSNPANQFVEKYDASGTYYWHNMYSNDIAPGAQSITSDNSGNCYVVYNIVESTAYGSYTVATHAPFTFGSMVMAIVKIDNTGAVQFAKGDLDVTGSLAQAFGIAADNQGFLYIGGNLQGQGGFDATTLNTGSHTEAMLAKLGSSVTAGISEQSKIDGVSVFPNPSKNTVYIGNLHDKAKYSMADVQGREVLSGAVSPDDRRIDLSQVPAGVYMLELQSNGAAYHQKLIVEK